MSSPSVVKGDPEAAPLLEHDNTDEAEIIKEITAFLKFGKRDREEESNTEEPSKVVSKRKKKVEENIPPHVLTEVFLRIFYPISACISKSVSVGLMKSLDYSPTVILHHGTKRVLFSQNAWESFLKHVHLIECYLTNSLCGRKTHIRLLDCDNEIDIVKHRGQLQVRIRDLTQHENKILLSREEFYVLNYATEPITRYMRQLVFASAIIKEYLVDTLEKQPDSTIVYGPVDTSIFNRIPHEVYMWRKLKDFEPLVETATEAVEETTQEEEAKNQEEENEKQEEEENKKQEEEVKKD